MPATTRPAPATQHTATAHPEAADFTPAALILLDQCKKRPTLLRIHVLESLLALNAQRGGGTVEQLYFHLEHRRAHVSLPSIYKVLAELVAAQVVDRQPLEHGPTIFVIRRQEHRLHLVCSDCQTVKSIEATALRKQLLAAAQAQDFLVDDVTFTLRGRCSACARSTSPPARSRRADGRTVRNAEPH